MPKLSGKEICSITESFEENAVCVRLNLSGSIPDGNRTRQLTVTTKAGEILISLG